MDKRATSGRGEPIPSILKKPRSRRKGDLLDKSTKIKGEKVEGGARRSAGPGAPPQGCSALMYACQQADYKAVVDILNKDVSANMQVMPPSRSRQLSVLHRMLACCC